MDRTGLSDSAPGTNHASAKCEPQHRSWSHPGLIGPVGDAAGWQSTTHSSYAEPKPQVFDTVGERRKMLEKFYWQELMDELKQELTAPNPIEKYETEYEGEYNVEDFKPDIEKIGTGTELHQKYPLYSDHPLTYWQPNGANITASGTTKIAQLCHPFRRNSQFSKPLADILDEAPYA